MAYHDLPTSILTFIRERIVTAGAPPTAAEITSHTGASRSTVNRTLAQLVKAGSLEKVGSGPATAYRPTADDVLPLLPASATGAEARALRESLSRPLGRRRPVSYDRAFVDDYLPNETSMLPAALAETLFRSGRAEGQQPAGTVARKVLEPLLIDLSWHSSRLEGNPVSLLDTCELFERGRGDASDPNMTMLLNHKEAIEFLVDSGSEHGMTVPVIRNLHALLTQGLLSDAAAAGAIRRRIVTIDGSVYQPLQVPRLLEEMLDTIMAKVQLIRNPVEAAFFLWVNIAYLQPFEDGNKRTSRLSANLPLLLYNCAPLSFLDVEVSEYAVAMMGVYEERSVSLAVDLFEATYRRSIDKYRAALSAFGTADPLRARFREQLGSVIRRVVGGESLDSAAASLALGPPDRVAFTRLARGELEHLEIYNCARFRLPFTVVERWIRADRPGLED